MNSNHNNKQRPLAFLRQLLPAAPTDRDLVNCDMDPEHTLVAYHDARDRLWCLLTEYLTPVLSDVDRAEARNIFFSLARGFKFLRYDPQADWFVMAATAADHDGQPDLAPSKAQEHRLPEAS